MKLLYLSLHPPLDPAAVATGNQVRDAGLKKALEAAGHEVMSLAPASSGKSGDGFYTSGKELQGLLAESGADALMVGYWLLLEHLPQTSIPVIVDFIAPRLLEAMYQQTGTLQHESRQLLRLLPRADHFLVGNQRQQDMLLTLLLLSGFDCRQVLPISIVPISTSGPIGQSKADSDTVCLVNAGVDWPWRQSGDFIRVIQEFTDRHANINFRQLSGQYPGTGAADADSGLASYSHMQELIAASHIGVELGLRNTEREFSHSFRMIEYLQCGLPVLVNSWLPVAGRIACYDAGWLVDSPAQLQQVLEEIVGEPGIVQAKTHGARALAGQELNYDNSCRPLLDYLDKPYRPAREVFSLLGTESGQTQVLGIPEDSRGRRAKAILKQLYKLLFCRRRPGNTPHVLMVTRADLFPADHGAAVKILRTAEALSRSGRDVYLSTDNRRQFYRFREGHMSTHSLPLWLRLLALPRPVALLRLMLKGYPASNAFLYFPVTDSSYSFRALYLATRFAIGSYLAEFPAYVRPCRLCRAMFGGNIVLVEHNVEYERIKAQVKDLSASGYRQLRQLELGMCNIADEVITVSQQDRQVLNGAGVDPRKLHTIPHGVDLAAFTAAEPIDIHRQYGIPADHRILVYHGTYSYLPNLEAMTVMAQEILPRLQERGLKVSVLAIGSKPPDYPLHRDIHFTGSVDRLESVLPAADLALVPLQKGGGTRMKILDYFAAGVPVIATSKGIEGIPVEHGRQALILDDFDAICEAAAKVLADPQLCRQLTDSASEFVSEMSWDAIVGRYLPLLN
ncbi:MAG: glycosyltransferase [Pseudohongiellaceae bacterium]